MFTTLKSGEKVLSTTGKHWYAYMRAMIGTIIFFFIGLAITVAFAQSGSELAYEMGMPYALEELVPWYTSIMGPLLTIYLIRRWFVLSRIRIFITNIRIVKERGILTRTAQECPINKVTDQFIRETILGRMLGYGHLDLSSPTRQLPFKYARKARAVITLVNELKEHYDSGSDPALRSAHTHSAHRSALNNVSNGVPTGDRYDLLFKLDELRQRGLLSESEFQAEKQRILAS